MEEKYARDSESSLRQILILPRECDTMICRRFRSTHVYPKGILIHANGKNRVFDKKKASREA